MKVLSVVVLSSKIVQSNEGVLSVVVLRSHIESNPTSGTDSKQVI